MRSFISQPGVVGDMDQQAHVVESVVQADPAPAVEPALPVEPQADAAPIEVRKKIQKKRKFVRTAFVQLPMRTGGFVEVPTRAAT